MIQEYCGYSHYALMPSRFLETFGLSALEALSTGVPVIGQAIGGMTSFVHPDLDVQTGPGQSLTDVLYRKLVSLMTSDDRPTYDTRIHHVVLQYSDFYRQQRFNGFFDQSSDNLTHHVDNTQNTRKKTTLTRDNSHKKT